ncbi:hypothetical protein [Agrococcus sp. Marseille-Q4369]|uniref:hypothetical protein n=1 Tax=Agrococcus sp. Marseille-Q4369 TaxID=2810513 RepID=UPI001B8ABF2B|nr:hypothetical protein [Agrococcus sp. Marseille-Q4369]QUW18406.1 hypothetical protein JSQ78_11390 [Agrococcus sp. Marseille-Q4369]
MPSPMPEFEMPSARPTVEAEVDDEPHSEHAGLDAAPRDDDRSVEGARRRRLVVGAVLAAALAVVALAVGIAQAVQRHAHSLANEAVTAAAADYLTAIAEGRGDDASALVPVEGDAPLLTDAALADAERIDRFGVGAVELDGDAATVEVSYRAGQRSAERRLQAVREGDGWRIVTSLAEPVRLDAMQSVALPAYLGVDLGGDSPTLLYPGVYAADPVEHALVDFGPLALVVDGDPSTSVVSEPRVWRVDEEVVEAARERALAHALACGAVQACPRGGAGATLGDFTSMAPVAGGIVELDVPVSVPGAAGDVRVAVRARADGAGGIDWECSGPAVLDPAGEEHAWEACR